jgi:hypothetical protein
MFMLHFEITDQGGELFRHLERFTISGLARVRVTELKDEECKDWSGTVKMFRAQSSRPFVVCVVSDHTQENQDGSTTDHSSVFAYSAEKHLGLHEHLSETEICSLVSGVELVGREAAYRVRYHLGGCLSCEGLVRTRKEQCQTAAV